MGILKDTIREFLKDDCPRMAAALSYYTMFSMPALLILVMLIAGVFADPDALQGRIMEQMEALIGRGAAEQVVETLRLAEGPAAGNPLVVVLSVAALLFAATGAFAQLQGALNRAWEVEANPDRHDVVNFLMKRGLSFLMIVGIALLLLASMLGSTLLAAFGDFIAALLPRPFSRVALHAMSLGATFVVATFLFGVLFRILPDARVHWRDAWRGAVATAALFILGNFLMGVYFARSSPGSAFGAAGSLALILAWVYYSSNIFFIGAELTQVLARRRGEGIRPSRGAVRVVVERRRIED